MKEDSNHSKIRPWRHSGVTAFCVLRVYQDCKTKNKLGSQVSLHYVIPHLSNGPQSAQVGCLYAELSNDERK